jgi:hypothetical protein
MREVSAINQAVQLAAVARREARGAARAQLTRQPLREAALVVAGVVILCGLGLFRSLPVLAQDQGSFQPSKPVLLKASVTTLDPKTQFGDPTNEGDPQAVVRLVRVEYRYEFPVGQNAADMQKALDILATTKRTDDLVAIFRTSPDILPFPIDCNCQSTTPNLILVGGRTSEDVSLTLIGTATFHPDLADPARGQDPTRVAADFPPAPPMDNDFRKANCYRIIQFPAPPDPTAPPPAGPQVYQVYEFCSFYAFTKTLVDDNGAATADPTSIDLKIGSTHITFPLLVAGYNRCGGRTTLTGCSETTPTSGGTGGGGTVSAVSGGVTGGGGAGSSVPTGALPPVVESALTSVTDNGQFTPRYSSGPGGPSLEYYQTVNRQKGYYTEATWVSPSFPIPQGTPLVVEAFIPASQENKGPTGNAEFQIQYAGGTLTVPQPETPGGVWVTLGTFPFNAGVWSVTLVDETGEPKRTTSVLADRVRWRNP